MDYKFKVGNDNGNSEHKLLVDEKLIIAPNVNAEITDIPEDESKDLAYMVEHIHEELIVTVSSIKDKNRILGTYMIGDRASRSRYVCDSIDVGATNSKVDTDLIIINTNAHIAAHAVQRYYGEMNVLPEELSVMVNMTTSLPVKQYDTSTKRKLAARFMKDYNHEIIVHLKDSSVRVKLIYEFVLVVPESVPVVHAFEHYNHEEWAKYIDQDPSKYPKLYDAFEKDYSTENEAFVVTADTFRGKDILHVAPGEGTTELPMTRGVQFDPDFIMGSDNGIGIAIENALPSFKKEMKLTKFTRQQYSKIVKDKNDRYHQKGMKHLKPHLKPEANDIMKCMRAELDKANNGVDFIVAHGGGTILLRDMLYQQIRNHVDDLGIKLFYVPEAYAVILEAIGLYELCKSELYEKVKERYIRENSVLQGV